MRIVGGIDAVPYSWPSHVLVKQFIKKDYRFPDGKLQTISMVYQCAGTLISRYTILTAGHCITYTFDYDYQGITYSLQVEPNQYYPTLESSFKVYLGVHDISILPSNSVPPIVVGSISKIIRVYKNSFKLISHFKVLLWF